MNGQWTLHQGIWKKWNYQRNVGYDDEKMNLQNNDDEVDNLESGFFNMTGRPEKKLAVTIFGDVKSVPIWPKPYRDGCDHRSTQVKNQSIKTSKKTKCLILTNALLYHVSLLYGRWDNRHTNTNTEIIKWATNFIVTKHRWSLVNGHCREVTLQIRQRIRVKIRTCQLVM